MDSTNYFSPGRCSHETSDVEDERANQHQRDDASLNMNYSGRSFDCNSIHSARKDKGASENFEKVKIRFILFIQPQDALMLPDSIETKSPDGF